MNVSCNLNNCKFFIYVVNLYIFFRRNIMFIHNKIDTFFKKIFFDKDKN